jgi:GrpB-like predicted nucleotidyltransferase (UPF0157 family)
MIPALNIFPALVKRDKIMSKPLSEMTLEELWQLFPIFLTEYQTYWTEWYQEEYTLLSAILSKNYIVRINHIGSTAIKGIWAKPIIDILVEIIEQTNMQLICDILTENGYLCMSQSENRMSFNKGYTERGFSEKVFHLHLRYIGDNDELYFRDYLNEHADIAKEYENLKISLWKLYEHNRDRYTNAKGNFIANVMKMAKEKYSY